VKSTFVFRLAIALLSADPLSSAAGTFAQDVAFLQAHTPLIVLSDHSGVSRVAVAPAWQARVMTSTAQGDSGSSFGWINRELIASGKLQPHINVFGGEDRFWLGPEGGQFGIYFPRGAKFDLEHWQVPPALDTRPFKVSSIRGDRALFHAEFTLANWSGAKFAIAVQREVRVLESRESWSVLGVPRSDKLALVAYQSVNRLTNAGKKRWSKDTGLLSIWILGMFNPSPSATVVVPLNARCDRAGVRSDYFGELPPARLKITDHAVFFSGDGRFRSKIGIKPRCGMGRLGSYDADQHVLTLVLFDQPEEPTDYVNSLWMIQDDPCGGDAINSYNDGPPAPGAKPLGPFYELESSSPAATLAPGASVTHTRKTLHVTGPEVELDALIRAVLGVSLAEVEAFRADQISRDRG
jgi:hypothetical protein